MAFKLGNKEWPSKEDYLAERDRFLGERAKIKRKEWAGIVFALADIDVGIAIMREWLVKIGAWAKTDLNNIKKWDGIIDKRLNRMPKFPNALSEEFMCIRDGICSDIPIDLIKKLDMQSIDDRMRAAVRAGMEPWPPNILRRVLIFLKRPHTKTFECLLAPSFCRFSYTNSQT